MNLRYKLANWISGGKLAWLDDQFVRLDVLVMVKDQYLQDIAAQEKPTSNATVRRMARMAREAINV